MGNQRTARPQHAAGLGALLCGVALTSAWWLGRQVIRTWPGSGSTSVDSALLSVTLAAAALLMCWVTGVVTLAVLELLREGDRLRGRFGLRGDDGVDGRRGGRMPAQRSPVPTPLNPRTAHRVSALLLALTAVPAHAAAAGPPEPSWTGTSSDTVAGSVSTPGPAPAEEPLLPDGSPVPLPGWTPVPVPVPARPTAAIELVSAAPREAPTEHVVVRAGDTLWSLAARHLGGQATVQDVAEEWPRWYAANREVIGPDPDLILPGQELRIPAAPTEQPPAAGQGARR